MRTSTTRLLTSLAMTLPAIFQPAFAKYTEQWVSNAELPRIQPAARGHASAKTSPAKAKPKVEQASTDDPIAAFARKTPASHR